MSTKRLASQAAFHLPYPLPDITDTTLSLDRPSSYSSPGAAQATLPAGKPHHIHPDPLTRLSIHSSSTHSSILPNLPCRYPRPQKGGNGSPVTFPGALARQGPWDLAGKSHLIITDTHVRLQHTTHTTHHTHHTPHTTHHRLTTPERDGQRKPQTSAGTGR
jgi:hypothetical protein